MPAQMGCLDWAAGMAQLEWNDPTRAGIVAPSGTATGNDVRLPFRPSLATGRRLKRIFYFDSDLRTRDISDTLVLFRETEILVIFRRPHRCHSVSRATGRNPGKGPGFTDFGPEKWPNPTQSEMWRTVSLPAIGNFLSSCFPIVIRPK
jgi:hypothetical protein